VWLVEPSDIALDRAPSYARRFFNSLFEEFPVLVDNVAFDRWSEQPDDLYAFFTASRGEFAVQVDAALDYIIVWGSDHKGEYGDWDGEELQISRALAHARDAVNELWGRSVS
jgi:hypothetical protein